MAEAGIGPTALGRAIGTNKQNILRWADQTRRLRPEWAMKIAPVLNTSWTQLITDDDLSPVQEVPLVSWVVAGSLIDSSTQELEEDAPLIPFADLPAGDWFGLRVVGDSMNRISPDGSVILVNREDRELIAGKPYVFSVKGEATFKIWEPEPMRLEPYSVNEAHKPIYLRRKDQALPIGRVRRTVLDL